MNIFLKQQCLVLAKVLENKLIILLQFKIHTYDHDEFHHIYSLVCVYHLIHGSKFLEKRMFVLLPELQIDIVICS